MIAGFGNGQGLSGLIDGWIRGPELGESKDDVFSSAAHDVEEMFLSNPFNVGVESTSIANCTSFVHGLVYISNSDGGSEFLGGETVFSDELPVDA